MDIISLIITGAVINNIFVIFSTLISIISKHITIYKFDSSADQINTEDILKEIKTNKSFVSGYSYKEGIKRPEGIFYNIQKRYVGYIENYQITNNYSSKINCKVWLIGKLPIKVKCINTTEEENNDDNNDEKKLNEHIKIYLSCDYYEGNFKDISLPLKFEPYKEQMDIIERIETTYNSNPFSICRSLIWGKPGGGKSFIGKLLAKRYKSAYSFDIKLLDPGTPILNLWRTVMPTKEKPLIIQIDEFDIIIRKIHNVSKKLEPEKPHQWLRTIVADKQSYNTFLSEYLICLPYVIYLFTMNSSPEEINNLDASYIRSNRIDLILPLDREKEKTY